MKFFYIFLVAAVFMACKEVPSKSDVASQEEVAENEVAKLPIYNFDQLESRLHLEDEKIYVINFWATWCKPCIKELPYFETLGQNYKGKNVEVILVSLDFVDQIDKQLIPFIEKRQLQSEVILLDDADSNSWIPKVDKNWSGAIPATIIYNKDKRAFYEKSFSYEELEEVIKTFL